MRIGVGHLGYCSNIHPAESWDETRQVLATHVLAVRQELRANGSLGSDEPYGIGLRLSARAAEELLRGASLSEFARWLTRENAYVFTINGFPFGNFHGERVKERVFQPDWTTRERFQYTENLFAILARIGVPAVGGSVSTVPGSHKWFDADESCVHQQLSELAGKIEDMAVSHGIDLHLGLEPEPFGMIEQSAETRVFFSRLQESAGHSDVVQRRIGLNYDTCHFALQYESAAEALNGMVSAGIRLSKLHLANALTFDPRDRAARTAIRPFAEPIYFHQTLCRDAKNRITRFADLPEFLALSDEQYDRFEEARVHFHVPLDQPAAPPLFSTSDHVIEALQWWLCHPSACPHLEIETYTWSVLPQAWQRPVSQQIAAEYRWVLEQLENSGVAGMRADDTVRR